ncbi:Uncharacterised protein [Mycobacteroides abscessus]|nr:Uncharacterised protein [Mycobacteroides abscessus]CPS52226.1 Uncharacterised protein [Mycobacteroides abscessus]CPY77583.1 Uncharacterised protein [Mycobacteroides abscessus]CPY79994.1 Uncharacterised protein [Mycobacteroides abscessus]SLJ40153.1 Uncharacterised protein [Mycobacteroides abscessus subsp. abscessus]
MIIAHSQELIHGRVVPTDDHHRIRAGAASHLLGHSVHVINELAHSRLRIVHGWARRKGARNDLHRAVTRAQLVVLVDVNLSGGFLRWFAFPYRVASRAAAAGQAMPGRTTSACRYTPRPCLACGQLTIDQIVSFQRVDLGDHSVFRISFQRLAAPAPARSITVIFGRCNTVCSWPRYMPVPHTVPVIFTRSPRPTSYRQLAVPLHMST